MFSRRATKLHEKGRFSRVFEKWGDTCLLCPPCFYIHDLCFLLSVNQKYFHFYLRIFYKIFFYSHIIFSLGKCTYILLSQKSCLKKLTFIASIRLFELQFAGFSISKHIICIVIWNHHRLLLLISSILS